MRDRFHIGRAAHGLVAGAHAIVASESWQPGFAEMIGQQFRFVRGHVGKTLLQRLGDAPVPFAPAHQQQAFIGGVAHQRVLEVEAPLKTALLGKHNSRGDQLCQHAFEFARCSCRPPLPAARSVNCRPITAAIWATSRAPPRRSRRAISESFSVAGTAESSPADSITLRVSSSTNSGTPSVLATIAAIVSADRPCAAATPATTCMHSPRPRRPSVNQRCVRPAPARAA